MGQPTDYEPLLPRGLHVVTLERLRALCVAPFDSLSRPRLMAGVEVLVEKVASANVPAELWINGSFLVKDPEPKDVDVGLVLPYHIFSGSAASDLKKWVREESAEVGLDVFQLIVHPKEVAMFRVWEAERAEFERLYGHHYDKMKPKGIAVIEFRGGTKCRT